MSTPTLEWFEGTCQELQTNPTKASKALESFRAEAYALEACHSWIQTPGCSPLAQFQLALVIQYSSLRNWSHLSPETVGSLRETLWSLIESAVAQDNMPPYALNKVIQIFVLLWKRSWKDATEQEQTVPFQHISGFLATAQTQSSGGVEGVTMIANLRAFKYGPMILRTFLEEFNSINTTEIALPLEFHEKSHKKFEKYGLGESLRLGMGCLSVSLELVSSIDSDNLHSDIVVIVAETLKLFIELLQWNFQSHVGKAASLLHLPRSWAASIMSHELIEKIFNTYNKLRARYLQLASQASDYDSSGGGEGLMRKPVAEVTTRLNSVRDIGSCLTELRLLITTLASIAVSPFFESNAERVAFGDALTSKTQALLEVSISGGSHGISCTSSLSLLVEELRSRECESFCITFLRLLGNFRLALCYQMPSFHAMVLAIGEGVLKLTVEINERLQVSLTKLSSQQDWNDEESLFQGWRGEALALLFDSWCIILDDPVMLRPAHLNIDDTSSAATPADEARLSATQVLQLKNHMAQMASQVYADLFNCYNHSVLHEALLGIEQEEDEEEENIESRNKNDILTCIGTIGRSSFLSSAELVSSVLCTASHQAETAINSGQSPGQAETLRLLETMRIATLFGCHLFVEDFKTDLTTSLGSSSEAPVLPQGVLDTASAHDAQTATESVMKLFMAVTGCLKQQMDLISFSSSGLSHPLVSPYLLQQLFRFLTEYFLLFFDPAAEALYYEQCHNVLLHIHGPEFNATVETLLAYCKQVIATLPLEMDVVRAVASLIATMARTTQPQRLAFVLGTPSISGIFHLLTTSTSQQQQQGEICRLNDEGLAAMFKALSWLAIKAGNTEVFMQLCTYVHNIASELAHVQAAKQRDKTMSLSLEHQKPLQQLVACLLGICATPGGLDRILRELFDGVLPLLAWCAHEMATLRRDDITTSILQLLKEYADYKLMGLPQTSTMVLYRASEQVMAVMLRSLDYHMTQGSGSKGGAADEEREEFRSNTILSLLQLLNLLSSKDFFLDCEDDVAAVVAASGVVNPATGQNDVQAEVCSVLVTGLRAIVPLLSAELLRSYPATCDRYFSYVTFIINSYMENLDVALNGDKGVNNDDKTNFFVTLMQHLLWGAGAVDPTAARLAFKSIQALADYYFTGLRGNGNARIGLGPGDSIGPAAATAIFPTAISRLLEMIFFPATCEYGIATDRIDACGNALITLVALDGNQFMQCAHTIVTQYAQHHPAAEEPLFKCFEKLTRDRGVNMGAIDKRNRMTFCLNFREFVMAVKPMVRDT